ncbi:uncharacterized protein LOC111901872 [Lactuca sativa]|uniref:uncharacterized protein LOC111901872 n=1 Tax=Lactuca sativa TaxID=4236 RepID=UPI001C68D0D8|nr:uncharacterized protein LOC111901872 [Lactuca sativa]
MIRRLPANICMLKHLKSLKLIWCCLLEELPKNLDLLEHLEELDLSYTKIKQLPSSICMLKHLKSLDISCSLLEKLPEDLDQLECLEVLSLWTCEFLQDIPNSICEMKCLKYFYLQDCIRVEKLPEEFGRLECLEVLNIEGTMKEHIYLHLGHLPPEALKKRLPCFSGIAAIFGSLLVLMLQRSQFQFCLTVHYNMGGIPTNYHERHVDFCMHRVNLLRHYGVKPILVFDGGHLPMKNEQKIKRARSRKENLARAIEHESFGNTLVAYECYKKVVDISPTIAYELILAFPTNQKKATTNCECAVCKQKQTHMFF